MRKWGLDGLDYIYDHPPRSSAQVMHPKEMLGVARLPGADLICPKPCPEVGKQVSLDSVGEAGMAVLFGCQF